MQSKPTTDAMFYQAASIPLQHIPPLEYLLTLLPRQYPMFPLPALDPSIQHSYVQHMLYREQRTYSPSTSYSRSPQPSPKPTPRTLPTVKLLAEMHENGFKGKDHSALFDFLASKLPASSPLELTDVWTDYFRQYPSGINFSTALLFILNLRAAYDQSLSQFETNYAQRLSHTFASIGATKCSLSWDRNTESRTWSIHGPIPVSIQPHSKTPNAIRIVLPHLFNRTSPSLFNELLNPHHDQLLLQCEHLAQANGFTTY